MGPWTRDPSGEPDPSALVDALRARGAVFALGSRAGGEECPESDLDVGAWFLDDPPQAWEVETPARVDLVVLNHAPLELAGRIAFEGAILFDDDPPARVRWVADIHKIWLDEKPRFERAHREFMEAATRGR